jgi:hypothetical protein
MGTITHILYLNNLHVECQVLVSCGDFGKFGHLLRYSYNDGGYNTQPEHSVSWSLHVKHAMADQESRRDDDIWVSPYLNSWRTVDTYDVIVGFTSRPLLMKLEFL